MSSDRNPILEELARVPEGLTVAELHTRLGGSDSGLRRELAALSAAGVIASSRNAPCGPGRPSLRFQLARPSGGWAEIVPMLVDLVGVEDRAAEERIAAFGRERGAAMAGGDVPDRVFALQARLGFAPAQAVRGGEVVMRFGTCPFREAVPERGAGAVCALHRGLLEGAVAGVGGAVIDFEPRDPVEAGCRARFRLDA